MERLSREYTIAYRQKRELEEKLDSFERGHEKRTVAATQTLEALCFSLSTKVAKLENLLSTAAPSNVLWSRRISSLKDDLLVIERTLQASVGTEYLVRAAEQRRRLIARRPDRQEQTAVEGFVNERGKLSEISQMLDVMTQQGKHVVQNLLEQNQTLKGARGMVSRFGLSLGRSIGIVGGAERRHDVDRWIVRGGMVFCMVLFGFLYWFKHYR